MCNTVSARSVDSAWDEATASSDGPISSSRRRVVVVGMCAFSRRIGCHVQDASVLVAVGEKLRGAAGEWVPTGGGQLVENTKASVCFPNSSINDTPTTSTIPNPMASISPQESITRASSFHQPTPPPPFSSSFPAALWLQGTLPPLKPSMGEKVDWGSQSSSASSVGPRICFWGGYFILLDRIVLSGSCLGFLLVILPRLRLSPNLDRRCWAFWHGSGTVHGTNQRQVTANPPLESLIYALPRTQMDSSCVAQHSTSHPSIPPDPSQPWVARLAFRAALKAVPSPRGAFGALPRLGTRSSRSGSQI